MTKDINPNDYFMWCGRILLIWKDGIGFTVFGKPMTEAMSNLEVSSMLRESIGERMRKDFAELVTVMEMKP